MAKNNGSPKVPNHGILGDNWLNIRVYPELEAKLARRTKKERRSSKSEMARIILEDGLKND